MSQMPQNELGRTLADRLVIPTVEVAANAITTALDATQKLTQKRIVWIAAILFALVSATGAVLYLSSSTPDDSPQHIVLSSMMDLSADTAEATQSDQPSPDRLAQMSVPQPFARLPLPTSLLPSIDTAATVESPHENSGSALRGSGQSEKWIVKLAAFQDESRAQRVQRRFEALGHQVWHAESTDGNTTWYRIYMGTYDSPSLAQSAFEQLQQTVPWLAGCQILPYVPDLSPGNELDSQPVSSAMRSVERG